MVKGDFILVHTPRDFVCWLIRKVTDSHWNHVAWVCDEDRVIESQGETGVQIAPLSKYVGADVKVKRLLPGLLCPEDLDLALQMACEAVGRPYDWRLILSLLWLYVTGTRKRKKARDWNNSWICSELIAVPLWTVAGFSFRQGVPVRNTVPADIDLSIKCMDVLG